MLAHWTGCTIEVGPHTAVNPDHGSMVGCYACGQSWFYADPPPPTCQVQTLSPRMQDNYLFFLQAQAEGRWPHYDFRPEEIGQWTREWTC